MEGQWNPMTPSKFFPIKRAQQTSSPNWLESLDCNEGGQIDGPSGGDLQTLVNNNEGLAQMNYGKHLAMNGPEIMTKMNLVHPMVTWFGGSGGGDGSQEMNGESSNGSRSLLNGKILLPSNGENGDGRFPPLAEPKPQYEMAIPLLRNLNSLPQNDTAMASPSTPAAMDKNQRESVQDHWPCEIIDLVGETSDEPLEQCFSDQAEPSQNITFQHQEGESHAVVNSSDEIPLQETEGEHQDIDLNKTPQQKARRKKHRPKVIQEGKPARTPKTTNPKPATLKDAKTTESPLGKRKYVRKQKDGHPQENPSSATPNDATTTKTPSGKRKYVRKKKDDKPQETPSSATQESKITEPDNRIRNKPVRRSLNFDLENSLAVDQLSETKVQEAAVSSSTKLAGQGHEMGNLTGRGNVRVPQTPTRPRPLPNQSAIDNINVPKTPNQPLQLSRLQMMKRKWEDDFARLVFNMTPCESERREGESSKNVDEKSNCQNIEANHERHLEVGEIDPKGTNGKYNLLHNGQNQANIRVTGSCSSNTNKKLRLDNAQKMFTSNDSSTSPHTPPSGWKTVRTMQNNHRDAFTSAYAQRFMANEKRKSLNRTLVVHQVVRVSCAIQVQASSRINHCTAVEGDRASTPTKMDYNQPPTPVNSHKYCNSQENEIYGPKPWVEALIAKQMKSKNKRQRKKDKDPLLCLMAKNASQVELVIDYIVRKLRCLNINGANEAVDEPQNALVPYNGGGGAMVRFEGPFDLIKKISKPRAKVDLDSESKRVWELLMGKECEGGTDMDKEKWWEEERRIFQGRTDSFIARMHLIQGDRTFSRWKGSVVDSVIGVFLTQNVSDHLSSSAFMCLAARFPPQFKVNSITVDVETIRRPVISEPELCDRSLSGTDESGQIDKDMADQNESFGSNIGVGSLEYSRESSSDFHELELRMGHESLNSILRNGRSSGDVVSSHNSVASSQNSSQCPCLKFEADRLITGGQGKGVSSFTELLQMANDWVLNDMNVTGNGRILCEEYGGEIDWPALLRVDKCQPMLNEGRQSCVPPASDKIAHFADSCEPICKNTEQPVTTPSGIVVKLPIQREMSYCCPSETNPEKNVSGKCSNQQDENTVVFQMGRTQPEIDSRAQTCSQNDNQRSNLTAESNLRNEAFSSQKASTETLSNESKGKKAEAEKMKTYDWDNLRKQACPNGIRKERSRDTMDSLDYEAVRNADVSEIADAIRERGMNNLLAERIKDFLNRLVRDHGSIDLEWLRDVPPDKAKDYLLSVRGLGLKSVECVRLLTLHHLAFPVDTNVGRICVRLGWVPLQPLPESLQLHLLEMYPVLETIQKYLWPRLCKLDQRTLYELHYQLITFGKVFCTKSKPNCNACPMRGECRHFASAFASARLALPGPEEKCIVSSETPLSSEQGHGPAPNPMPLPQLEGNMLPQEQTILRSCEPIVEEPGTPDPEFTETSVIDIEDAFYNDPDEIPTIKLNFEEFTQNLHNYMQECNMGLQDGDMSKALVALTPEAASIPVPKLKNVNRLRTEHLVYELPDCHPLLKGMDKREPDDPCPYLLAIWTPGETAQSTEAPKSCCNSQDTGKLCDNNTCFSCNSIREAQAQTVRGTILIPCRTANRGSFPLNGTYFQVNEVFADHDSSRNPIDVPRDWIWNLTRRTVYFGTSIPSIFKGLTTEGIQHCFWRGFVCVRGFDRMTRAPKPLFARLHLPASKVPRNRKTSAAPVPTPEPAAQVPAPPPARSWAPTREE